MAQVSSLRPLPDPSGPDPTRAAALKGIATGQSAVVIESAVVNGIDETERSPIQAQLTRLSGVLNGLQANAAVNRSQYVRILNKIKSGTYQVDPADVVRSIVANMFRQPLV